MVVHVFAVFASNGVHVFASNGVHVFASNGCICQ